VVCLSASGLKNLRERAAANGVCGDNGQAGFVPCAPFGDYLTSAYNAFMTVTLRSAESGELS
jgi:hypothetical protein